ADRGDRFAVPHDEAVVLDRAVEIRERLAFARVREAENPRADRRETFVVRRDELRLGIELPDRERVSLAPLEDENVGGRDPGRDGLGAERDAGRASAHDDEVEEASVFAHGPHVSRTTVAPHPPRSGVASSNDVTSEDRSSVVLTIARPTPLPRPWIRRTSRKPFAGAAGTCAATPEAVSPGRKGWRSRTPSMGIATRPSSPSGCIWTV